MYKNNLVFFRALKLDHVLFSYSKILLSLKKLQITRDRSQRMVIRLSLKFKHLRNIPNLVFWSRHVLHVLLPSIETTLDYRTGAYLGQMSKSKFFFQWNRSYIFLEFRLVIFASLFEKHSIVWSFFRALKADHVLFLNLKILLAKFSNIKKGDDQPLILETDTNLFQSITGCVSIYLFPI